MLRKILNVILAIIIVVLIVLLFTVDKSNKEVFISGKSETKKQESLSIMLETEINSGTYSLSNSNVWPEGYVFNELLSKCKNGSKIGWDSQNNQVILEGTSTDNCYVYFDINDTFTVTFDANGGTVSVPSKQAVYNQDYGELPTPTRAGYVFKGWNGKNLVNISNQNISFTNYYFDWTTPSIKYELLSNTNYTLSFDYVVNYSSYPLYDTIGYGVNQYDYDVFYSANYSGSGHKITSFKTPSAFSVSPPNVAFRLVRMSNKGDADVDISNVQFEEGSIATPYEPYYVTSSVKVTQDKNHILKAIWEPMDYGTAIESSYSNIYYSLNSGPKTLITNSLTGTWNGNFIGTQGMFSKIIQNGERIAISSLEDHSYVVVTAGNNVVNFTNPQANKWVYLHWQWGYSSNRKELSTIKLLFNDNSVLTVDQAVNSKYIEPLVIYISYDSSRENSPYVLTNPSELITGGSQTQDYSNMQIYFKVKDKSPLEGVSFYTDAGWSTAYNDGFSAFSSDTVEFSL